MNGFGSDESVFDDLRNFVKYCIFYERERYFYFIVKYIKFKVGNCYCK